MSRFALTIAECEVVLAIADGYATAHIAVARNVSVHTVRNQIKSAMSKLAIQRQIDLVRRIEAVRRGG